MENSNNTQTPKLTAHQCYKIKEEKKLSDEDFKKLLVENGIIMSLSDELDQLFYDKIKSAVLKIMIRKGVEEITIECVQIAKDYSEANLNLKSGPINDYIHEFAWEYGRLWNTELSYEEKMSIIGERIKLPHEFLNTNIIMSKKVSNKAETPALNNGDVRRSYSLDEVREITLEYRNTCMYGQSHNLTRFELQAELRKIDEKHGLDYKEGIDYNLA